MRVLWAVGLVVNASEVELIVLIEKDSHGASLYRYQRMELQTLVEW